MPAASSARPSMFGLRPVAIRRSPPSIVSSPCGVAIVTATLSPARATFATLTPARTTTPSRANCSSTIAAHSGSSCASGAAASSTVTFAPSRRCACASSSPTAPAPITMRCSNGRLRSNTVSLVRYGVSARPSIGGIAGVEPVAITKRRALMAVAPTATVPASRKCAAPSITRTPRPAKRSLESVGAIAAITPCTCACTLAKSTSAGAARNPKRPASRKAAACLAAASSAFEGTQP